MYSTRILKDSLAPCGKRLTTWELTYPRFVHAELMTHRVFSRNSASSRAIPTERLMARVREDPALPVYWGKNQAGMQAATALDDETQRQAQLVWLEARDQMLTAVEKLGALGLHKQLANRLIEPWMFITVLVTSTEWSNRYHLRNHKAAQPEIAWVAADMLPKYEASVPTSLAAGEWHLPLVSDDEMMVIADETTAKKISTGRCARVSYLTHEGVRDFDKDIELHDRLCAGPATGDPGHWSPFEHVAMALATADRSGNFVGFRQYRKEFTAEHFGGPML